MLRIPAYHLGPGADIQDIGFLLEFHLDQSESEQHVHHLRVVPDWPTVPPQAPILGHEVTDQPLLIRDIFSVGANRGKTIKILG